MLSNEEQPLSNNVEERIPLAREIEELGDAIKLLESFSFEDIQKIAENLPSKFKRFNPICIDRNKHLILRIDGHKFSTFTQGFDKPFDLDIMEAMLKTTEDLVKYFRGVTAYTQSDEITILITKPNDVSTYDFNGRRSKLESLAAGYASARFNHHLLLRYVNNYPNEDDNGLEIFRNLGETSLDSKVRKMLSGYAHFDCRVIQPSDNMIVSTFRWRQLDAFRNGTSILARDVVSEKKLMKLGTGERIKLLEETKYPIDKQPTHILHGTWIKRSFVDQTIKHPKTGDNIQCKRVIMVRNPGLVFPNNYLTIETPSLEWLLSEYYEH